MRKKRIHRQPMVRVQYEEDDGLKALQWRCKENCERIRKVRREGRFADCLMLSRVCSLLLMYKDLTAIVIRNTDEEGDQ